jgi:sulfatase maturation enzyme AslB (radical SAM superfamily)
MQLRPERLQIEICDICNLSCSYCDVNRVASAKRFMSFKRIVELVDQADFATHVFPQFWGEPTLHPDFEDVLAYCKSKGKIVSFYTNGTLLHKRDVEQIVRHSDLIHLSLAGITASDYRNTTASCHFEQLQDNVAGLWRAKGKTGSKCRIVIRVTDSFYSRSYKATFAELWGPFCDEIRWSPLRSLLTGTVAFPPLKRFTCEMIRCHCIVKCDGRLALCCTDHFGTVALGNAFDRGILDAFNSAAFSSVRENLDLLRICRNCWYRYPRTPKEPDN